MANREDILRMVAELENEEPVFWRDAVLKNYKEALTTAEFDPCRRLDGRTARKELSVYDAMMAEIMGEKERRERKYMRKHEIRNDGKPVRKEKRKSYKKELCDSCDPWNGWNVVRHIRYAEKIQTDAEDWKLEQEEIEEFIMWERINFDIETERLKTLGEWLKWA